MTSPREWWRRAATVVKDKRSICLTMVSLSRNGLRKPEMEAAVIRATSHSERSIDYKNAGRVFTWARTSSSFMVPLMWAISRRAERTHSWPVALKSLLLAHGLILISSNSITYGGRLPFDLADFHDDRSSPNSWGFSAFVRAYFQFLDNRAFLLPMKGENEDDDCGMNQVDKLQTLLDLLMQIRPYADGMDVGLILEAMDCAIIEIFEVYSGICNGIASFLVDVLGSSNSKMVIGEEERKRRGLKAIAILRRANEQSLLLTNYFQVCRSLGVLNATEFPPVDRIPDEDIMDLEKLVLRGIPQNRERADENRAKQEEKEKMMMMEDLIQLEEEEEEKYQVTPSEWVVFEDEFRSSGQEYFNNPFLCWPPGRQWASMVHCSGTTPWNGNLIELL